MRLLLLLLLLLLSLLVVDMSPLRDGDEDGVMENWSFSRNLLLKGRMTPRGLQILQTEHDSMSTQRTCVFVSVQRRQTTCPLSWTHTVPDGYGSSLSYKEFLGIILRNQNPAAVVSVLCGQSVPALKVLHVVDRAAHIVMRMIKPLPYSASASFLHHHNAASGHNFQAFFLEKSSSWAPTIILQLQKTLTERYFAAEAALISCCLKERGVKRARPIKRASRKQTEEGQIRSAESKQRAEGFTVIQEHDGQPLSKASVSQHDTFQAASLHPSRKPQLQIQRNTVSMGRKDEHLRQQSLKASSVRDDDGFYVQKKPLLVPREQPESINKAQHKIRATLDDNKEDFRGKIITEQAKLLRPEGARATEPSQKNLGNGNEGRLAHMLQAGVDNNDDKQMLSEEGEDVLILLFTQRETLTQSKVTVDADVKLKTVNIPSGELDDPPPGTKVIQENFLIYSRCKHLKEIPPSLEMYAAERTERKYIKAAKVIRESANSKKQVKVPAEKMEHAETNKAAHGNKSINHTKQEAPSEESVTPSPPSVTVMEKKTAKTDRTAENTQRRETTGSTQRADRPSEPDTQPTLPPCNCNHHEATRSEEKSSSGLRMRETHQHRETEQAATTRPHSDGNYFFTHAQPLKVTQKHGTHRPLRTTHAITPPCRGLIHSTEAGWKHCVQRYTGEESQTWAEPTSNRDHSDPDKNDHFYYFDGVMKRVRNNFYPYYKRQRLRKRRDDNTGKEETGENLLGYIRHLTSTSRDGHKK